jgi:hypothetical protein
LLFTSYECYTIFLEQIKTPKNMEWEKSLNNVIAQAIDHLPDKHEAMSSKSSTTKEKENRKSCKLRANFLTSQIQVMNHNLP